MDNGTNRIPKILKKQDGAVVVVIALLVVVLIAMSALAIDIGYLMVVRNQLQNAADSAALAAVRQLGNYYEGKQTPIDISSIRQTIIDAARNTALANEAAGKLLSTVRNEDIIIGKWDQTSKTITPTPGYDDAVRVIVRKDSIANGAVPSFIAGVIGINSNTVVAHGTAALTGQSTVVASGLPLPIGISKRWLQWCNGPITLYPTTCPGAGWHDYDGTYGRCGKNPSAACMKDLLGDLTNGTFSSPETDIGDSFYFTGGTLDSALQDFENLFDAMKVKNDGFLDNDLDPNTWTTSVVVYDDMSCANPNTPFQIVGFATVRITEVIATGGNKQINGVTLCGYTDPGRGGGGQFGTMGSIPQLVQ